MKKLDHLVNKSFVLLQVLKNNKESNAVQKKYPIYNQFRKIKKTLHQLQGFY
ncbi:hypothetical protein FORC36_5255 (plasmid) [Vibrio vulnificus]|nr:hypothetical protein FORC36_5255 [Vibrio vulnificus]